jgi:peptidoglycan/LPS O-acetylase OafA/YrhL
MNSGKRHNNFDVLRLVFALMVCLVHAYQLSGFAGLAWTSNYLSSDIAIKAFFVVSGYLVLQSYERSANVRDYVRKRASRIYPAYLVMLVLCVSGLWLLSNASAAEYLRGALSYLAANAVFLNFLHPTLPGVLEGNPLHAVNGALWTLKIEILFYTAVPALSLLLRRYGIWAAAVLYGASVAWAHLLPEALARQFPGQLAYFIVGAMLYLRPEWLRRCGKVLSVCAGVTMLMTRAIPLPIIEPFALGALVIGLALLTPPIRLRDDLSYGVYILHFPIIQSLIALGVTSSTSLVVASLGLTLTSAFAMWHLVERRFLVRSARETR